MLGITTSLALLTMASAVALPTFNSTAEAQRAMYRRQGGGPGGTTTDFVTLPISDPNPHQNYLHRQLSETITCDQSAGCSVGETETQSITVNWSLGIGKAVTEWITSGFSVSESWTTGNTYTCDGNAGQTVCIWYNTAHTAYTVESAACTGADCTSQGNAIILSPNDENQGGGYYCVVGTCQDQGSQYWENGCAGGPQSNCGNGQVFTP